MSVPSQKITNKSMTSLVYLYQSAQQYRKYHALKRTKSHHAKHKHKSKKRSGYIYFDSHDYVTKKKQISKSYYHEEDESLIDPSTIHRINPIIEDSFYSMSEVQPLTVYQQQSKSWPLLPRRRKPKQKQKSMFSYFKLKEIDHTNDMKQDINSSNDKYIYYYDEEKKQQKIFYKELNLSIDDIFKKNTNINNTECTQLDIVLNEYHNHQQSLPDIEHYFILLYYNIKQSSIAQLQQLWYKLYNLFRIKMKQNIPLPTIYINFKNGEEPTNINNVFNMLYHPEFGIDLKTLKDAVKQYYYQWHPKCILINDHDIKQQEPEQDVYLMMNDMETAEEHRQVFGYNADGVWSISDELQFPALPEGFNISPRSPTAEVIPDTPINIEPDEGQIFCFRHLKPKTAVVAGVFGVVATVGIRIFGARNPRFSQ